MLKHRILSGGLILATLVLAAFYLPGLGACCLLVALSGLAQMEFYALMTRARLPVFRVVGVACGSILIAGTFFTIGPSAAYVSNAYRWEHFALVLALIAVFMRQFPQKYNAKPLSTIGCTLLGLWYVPYLFNFFTRLAFSWEDPGLWGSVGVTGRSMIFYLVVVVKTTDMGAYFVGSWLGRHKLFPRLSPSKTWEGLLGGVAVAVSASCLYRAAAGSQLGLVSFRWVDALVLGVLLSLIGTLGDMFESLLKRAAGAKDSGSVIPGMGGVLDVLDSLLFGAPVLYIYAKFCMT